MALGCHTYALRCGVLKALNDEGLAVLGWYAERRKTYVCPECRRRVIPKLGNKVIHHFAHEPRADCPFGVGESLVHMTMKAQVGATLGSFGWHIDYEMPIVKTRRADLVLDHRIVVECQVSPISIEDLRARTLDYTRANYPVMWIWDHARVRAPIPSVLSDGTVVPTRSNVKRVPSEIRYIAELGHGLFYVCSRDGHVFSCVAERYTTECDLCGGTRVEQFGDHAGIRCRACNGTGTHRRKTMCRLRSFGLTERLDFKPTFIGGMLLAWFA